LGEERLEFLMNCLSQSEDDMLEDSDEESSISAFAKDILMQILVAIQMNNSMIKSNH